MSAGVVLPALIACRKAFAASKPSAEYVAGSALNLAL